jgi:hypothetical protein
MRLIDTKTLVLRDFFDSRIPPYIILSHRWEDGEVTFRDVTESLNLRAPGWTKIRRFCSIVRKFGYRWAWVDTCSIDKTSSAELSEAINSMYKWYERSDTCFVYLHDVVYEAQDVLQLDITRTSTEVFRHSADSKSRNVIPSKSTVSAFRESQWFTRGWTLQELIAPRNITFFDRDWRPFGSKDTLSDPISDITSIENIRNHSSLQQQSIATKMSWASKRNCTRSEDTAYSLMGLFDVNMPLLYGEGVRNAFRRLQLEILKVSSDESIFAWNDPDPDTNSMLASLPAAFAQSSRINPFTPSIPRQPFAMTNKGLEITTVILSSKASGLVKYLPLNCYREGEPTPLAIALERVGEGTYRRFRQGMVRRSVSFSKSLLLPEMEHLTGFRKLSVIHVVDRDEDSLLWRVLNARGKQLELSQVRMTMDRYLELGI